MKRELNAKLIVSDFDGTLIDSKHNVTDEVRQAINGYVEDGGIFVVATGRMLASILPQVRKLGLKGLVAGYQGTLIADIESGKILRSGGFTVEQTAEICEGLQKLNAYVNAYHGDNLYTDIPKDNKNLQLYEQITGVTAIGIEGKMSDFVRANNLACQKVTSLCHPKDKLALYDNLCKLFGGRYDVTYSADVLCEVSPLGDNKGEALKFIAAHYNIPLSETVAVGDNLNDLPMLKAAGTGVAVGNATQPLKDQADYITSGCDEGGVAKVIQEFGYKH